MKLGAGQACPTTLCSSPILKAGRFGRAPCRPTGATLPSASACPRSRSTDCGIPTPSQLIASGVDIVTISKRLGHAKPSVTLAIYAHMFHTDDSKAAAAINAALRNAWVAIGWQCSHLFSLASAAKSLKMQVRRGGRVAEGGGLLNRYTV